MVAVYLFVSPGFGKGGGETGGVLDVSGDNGVKRLRAGF